jgi:plasmid stability protein
MANLTLSLDDEVLRRARIRALEQGTSVNAIVRDYLEAFAGDSAAAGGLRAFLDLTESVAAGSGETGRSWSREDAHAR